MARLNIRLTGGSSGPFGIAGPPSVNVKIDVDEALTPKDFRRAVGVLTVTAAELIRTVPWAPDEAEVILTDAPPTVVYVPDDQVQAVGELNRGHHPDGLLIVPESAVKIDLDADGNEPAEEPWIDKKPEPGEREWEEPRESDIPPRPESPQAVDF